MTNNAAQAVNEAASVIKKHNPELAEAFVNQPLKRVDFAYAFLAGFDGDWPHEANYVVKIAELDRDLRRAENEIRRAEAEAR